MNQLSTKQQENALNEIRILASIESPAIVSYKQAFFDHNIHVLCIVMEYAGNISIIKMEEICIILSASTKNIKRVLNRLRYGVLSRIFLLGFKLFILELLCIEISSPLMSLKRRKVTSQAISMFLKSLLVTQPTLKLERHIMQVLKFGEMSPMTAKVIYGLQVALFSKWQL